MSRSNQRSTVLLHDRLVRLPLFDMWFVLIRFCSASWNIVTLLVSRMYLHLRTVDRTPLLLPTLTQLRPTRSHHSKQFVQRPSYDKRRSDGSLCIRSEPVCWEADEDNAAIEQLPAVARR